jgi:hypothetical protein
MDAVGRPTFAGLAYRIADGADGFEAIYLRPSMDSRPIRPVLETSARSSILPTPTGHSTGYERGTRTADTKHPPTPARTSGSTSRSTSRNWRRRDGNGTQVLKVTGTKAALVTGAVGLFVDIGSESYLSKLTIRPR